MQKAKEVCVIDDKIVKVRSPMYLMTTKLSCALIVELLNLPFFAFHSFEKKSPKSKRFF